MFWYGLLKKHVGTVEMLSEKRSDSVAIKRKIIVRNKDNKSKLFSVTIIDLGL